MPRSKTAESRLSRDEIVEEARRLVASEGVDALTMRRVGEVCGIQGPTLYWHFRDKEELVGHLVDSVVADLDVGTDAQSWTERVGVIAASYRRLLLEHRGLATALAARFSGSDTVFEGFEQVLAVLVDAGFTYRQALLLHYSVVTYTTGFALYEGSSPVFLLAAMPPGAPERQGARLLVPQLDDPRFPHLHELAPVLDDVTADELFEQGLAALVRGWVDVTG